LDFSPIKGDYQTAIVKKTAEEMMGDEEGEADGER